MSCGKTRVPVDTEPDKVHLTAEIESWPLDGEFVISRGAKREAVVVVAQIATDEFIGRGECVPYARYGETPAGVLADVLAMSGPVADGLSLNALQDVMPAGAPRNAIDCALWDLKCKQTCRSANDLAGLGAPKPMISAYTLSLGPAEEMAARAKWAARFPLLKLKLGGEGDQTRIRAVRQARPDARLIVDANEAWSNELLPDLLGVCREAGVELVEQPLPADRDAALGDIERQVPICADESAHMADGIANLAGRYDVVNIKLDKTGGLSHALEMLGQAHRHGMKTMVGCMVSTSLAMAPALVVATAADWVDLDGPLLLARDRDPGLTFRDAIITPAPTPLWGYRAE